MPHAAADELPQILIVPEVAGLMRVHEMTVYRMLERGELPGVKIAGRWRIRRADIDKLLAGEL